MPYRREHAEGFVGEIAAATWAAGGALFAVETAGRRRCLAGAMTLFPPRDGVGVGGYWTVAGQRGRGYTARGAAAALPTGRSTTWGCAGWSWSSTPATWARAASPRAPVSWPRDVLRQRSLHRGEPVDDVVYGLLATDRRLVG